MNAILVPIGSTSEAVRAAERVIARYRAEPVDVHLINVQHPLPRHVARFFPRSELKGFHHDAGMRVLAPATRALDAAGIPHHDHVVVGHAAEEDEQRLGLEDDEQYRHGHEQRDEEIAGHAGRAARTVPPWRGPSVRR